MLKNFNLLISMLLLIGIVFLSGCSEQENRNVEFMSSAIQVTDNENGYIELKEARKIGASVGAKNRELLSTVSEPDKPAILVNGIAITNRTVAYQKALQLYPGMRPLKEELISIVRLKVVQSEAIERKIRPSQEKIDDYLKEEMKNLKNRTEGLEFELGYIEGMGITIEEYVESRKQLVYDMFQREAFWSSVQPMKNSREHHIDDLLRQATIEVLDPEIKQLVCDNG